jgi:non-canonical purine NTP pyrophosphatase (RdgB/HAM1 family)
LSPASLYPEFVLVTGNAGKALEAERILGFRPVTHTLELPEIQDLDLRTVVAAKARAAWEQLRRPVVVDDTGLELLALNGFPGPLIKWLLTAVGASGLTRVANALGDPRARAVCALGYFDGESLRIAEGVVEGTLVPPRGEGGFGWDAVFQPSGLAETYAEMSADDKDLLGHRGRAWRSLAASLHGA